MPIVIRKARSMLLRSVRRLASLFRVLSARLLNDGVMIPWSMQVEPDVDIRVTDGGFLEMKGGSIGRGSRIVVQSAVVSMGEDVFIGQGCTITAMQSICIGARVLIAEYVTIRDQDHCIDSPDPIAMAGFECGAVEIGDDVWVGTKATILRGSAIGSGAVVGAHALVKGHVPARAIAVGVPARIARFRGGGHE